MQNKIIFSVDVEPDLHSSKYKGIREGLKRFEELCDSHGIKPVLFVVASTLKDNKEVFKRLQKKGWEVSCHGFSHKRFDDMSYEEKEEELRRSKEHFKKYLGIEPKGFRAPQHSIDDETLDLLERHGFEYDSSYTPLNLLQLFFFPRRMKAWAKQFFSRTNPYKIRENLMEFPISSIIIPPVSLIVRVFPKWCLYVYFKALKGIYREPIFYAHSWDFIELKESRIDRWFSHERFLDKLDYVMSITAK